MLSPFRGFVICFPVENLRGAARLLGITRRKLRPRPRLQAELPKNLRPGNTREAKNLAAGAAKDQLAAAEPVLARQDEHVDRVEIIQADAAASTAASPFWMTIRRLVSL